MNCLLILKESTDVDFWRLLMSIRTVGGMLLGGREEVERRHNPCKVVLFEFVRIITRSTLTWPTRRHCNQKRW